MKRLNFYSGPAILPQEVMDKAKAAIDNFEDTGLSILEISHRAKPFVAVMEGARSLVKELMGLDGDYEVLFLQGGASTQFHMVPYNLLEAGETAGYIDTGTWAHGAKLEAKLFGQVHVMASSRYDGYTHIPREWDISCRPYKYIHITTNNTIYGSQWGVEHIAKLRRHTNILVADMSSDILSRDIDYSMFDLIYAGAQKNIGIAGATVVIVRKSILGSLHHAIPKMIDYRQHIEHGSMRNTPSVFAVYTSYLMLQWIKKQGLQNIYAANQRKAKMLYDVIDSSDAYYANIEAKDDRSMMNVCFSLTDPNQNEKFSAYAKDHGMIGIDGHRSVGGFRASIYNAMPEAGVAALVKVMKAYH